MNACRRDLFAYCDENASELKHIIDIKEFEKYNKTNYRKI